MHVKRLKRAGLIRMKNSRVLQKMEEVGLMRTFDNKRGTWHWDISASNVSIDTSTAIVDVSDRSTDNLPGQK